MSLEEELKQKVGSIVDPEIGRSLGSLNMVKSTTIDGSTAAVTITLPTHAYPGRERLETAVNEAVGSLVENVSVTFEHNVRGKNTGGSIGLQVKNIIAVGSGKGGVGKSTVAACLASGLKSMGSKVGLMDADVYGPSIPHMMNAKAKAAATDKEGGDGQKITRIQPVEVDGIKLMSMGFFIEPGQAVVWRGPMLHKALTQFLKDTDWGELDYLIIDLPPGTGDVSLTLSQLVGLVGAVIVCTPQEVALLDAVKAVDMYNKVNVPILGIVENMSGEIFGRGGAKAKAEELNVPFLGEVPIEAIVRIQGDAGQIPSLFSEDNPAREALINVCQTTAMQIAKQLLETPQAPTLEIL